jgi:predicted ester cyclase
MTTAPSTEENKRLAVQWLQFVSEAKLEELCAITAPDWKMNGGKPGLSPGSDGVRELFASFGPIEQTWTVEDVIAEGEKVVVRAINYCRQESFLGIPSYGKEQVFTATFIFHIVNGKMIETSRNADDLGRVLQLGAKLVPVRS